MQSSFQRLLNDTLLAEQEQKNKRERSGKIIPSQLAQCFLRQYFYIKGFAFSNPPDLILLKRWLRGKIIHKYVQQLAAKKVGESNIEKKVEGIIKDAALFGFADVVNEEEQYVLDIKTQEDYVFKWHYTANFDVFKEKEPEWIQVSCYALLLGIPKVKLLFVNNKDVSKMEEYESRADRFKDLIEFNVEKLNSYVGNNMEPPAEPRLYVQNGVSQECKYCFFRSFCYERRGLKWEDK